MDDTESEELIAEGLRRMNAGDLDGMLELLHPEIEWSAITGPAGADVYRGHEGVRRFVGEWLEAWDTFSQELVDVRARGEWALVRTMIRTRGGISGIEFATEVTYLMQRRGDKLARMEMFQSYEEGLAAWEAMT
jgi:ketosteroid isomerase-like protein